MGRDRDRGRGRIPMERDEFGRKRRERSDSPVKLHDVGKRKGRSPSPLPRGGTSGGRRRSHSPYSKKRRHSRSPPGGERGRERGRDTDRDPPALRALYDVHHLLPIDAFTDKMTSTVESRDEARDLSPNSRKAATQAELKSLYNRYVDTFKDEDGPNRGEAMRFFHQHKEEEWFWERYHPEGRAKARKDREEHAKSNRDAFFEKELDWDKMEVAGLVMEIEPRLAIADRLGRKEEGDRGGGAVSKKQEEDPVNDDDEDDGGDDEMVTEGEGGMLVFSPKMHEHGKDKRPQQDKDAEQIKDEKEEGVREKGERAEEKGDGKLEGEGGVEARGSKHNVTSWCADVLNCKLSVFIGTVPPRAMRAQLERLFKEQDGFVSLVVSEVMSWKGWTRIAWARFETAEQAEVARRTLDGKEVPLLPVPEKDAERDDEDQPTPLLGCKFKLTCTGTKPIAEGRIIPKTAPMTVSTVRRMKEDFTLLCELVSALDQEKGMDENRLVNELKERDDDELPLKVDLLVHYLRRVHYVGYYKMEEFAALEEMLRKGAALCLRPRISEDFKDEDRDWENAHEERVRVRIEAAKAHVEEVGNETQTAEKLLTNFFSVNCVEIQKGQKYQCQLEFKGVKKLFKSPEFVIKHLWNKHSAKVKDELYLQSFLTDPNRPMEPPVAQHGSYPINNRMMQPGMYHGGRGGPPMRPGMLYPPPRGATMGVVGRGGMPIMGRGIPPPMAAGMMAAMAMHAGGFPPPHIMHQMVQGRGMPVQHEPRAPPAGRDRRPDPRGIKAYVDLDAAGPSYEAASIDYRSPSY